ncbi:MAG: PHP domain-containing protein [Clostridia bacterium]|nr:PHP domain-containing protein [Clostridia bacterium]
MKHYLLPEGGKFYKANMHLHTTVSDGCYTPEDIKKIYMDLGYSILAYTDHEVIVPHTDLTDENFLALTGYEITIWESGSHIDRKVFHLNLIAKEAENNVSSSFRLVDVDQDRQYVTEEMMKYNHPRKYSSECVNEIIESAKKEGFLVSLNHPVWSTQNYTDYADLKGLWATEVYNSASNLGGAIENTQAFEDLVRLHEPVFPLAVDDTHYPFHVGHGWIMVKAHSLDYPTVISALEKGDFYASTGPEIKELYLEEGILHIKTSEAAGIYVTTEKIKRWSAMGTEEEPVTEASFNVSDYVQRTLAGTTNKQAYIRVTVKDFKGEYAYSRAYFLDELAASV